MAAIWPSGPVVVQGATPKNPENPDFPLGLQRYMDLDGRVSNTEKAQKASGWTRWHQKLYTSLGTQEYIASIPNIYHTDDVGAGLSDVLYIYNFYLIEP